jgi:hypothetical protein
MNNRKVLKVVEAKSEGIGTGFKAYNFGQFITLALVQ